MIKCLVALGLALFASAADAQEAAPASEAQEHLRFERVVTRDRIEKDGSLIRQNEVRVLLRSTAAVTEFGQLIYPYIDGFGDVQFEEVTIEKPDRRVIAAGGGRLEDFNPYGTSVTSLPADLRYRKLTIAGLEPGDRLAYRLVVHQKPLAPGHVFGEIKFGVLAGEPEQTYELDQPRQAPLKVRLREGLGGAWTEVPGAADRLVRRLVVRVPRPPSDRPLTKAESRALNDPDVLYSSFGSWSEVTRWWWSVSKDRLQPDAAVRSEASRLVPEKVSDAEAIQALFPFVANRIRYLNVGFGLGRMQPRPAPEVLAARYGDCKDKHALLAALAKSLGIDVRPVFINSARADFVDEVPGPQQFDHLVSVVRNGPDPADWLWIDGTNAAGPLGYLLPGLRDKRAIVVEATGDATVVRTPSSPPYVPMREVEFKGRLETSGELSGRFLWRVRSDEESFLRTVFASFSPERLAEVVKQGLTGSWKQVRIKDLTFSDPLATAEPFRIEFEAAGPAPLDPGLQVPLPAFELPAMPKSEASATAAHDPIEFAIRRFAVRAEVELPESTNASPPLSVNLDRPFGSFRSRYTVDGRTLRIERSLSLSSGTLPTSERAAYESLSKAIETDWKQEFSVSGLEGSRTAAALRTQGLAALEAGNHAKAVELFQQATAQDPRVKDGFVKLGEALQGVGRNAEALAAFSRQVELEPFHEKAYAWRAYVLERLGRYEEAEADLLKQVEVAPFDAWSHDRLGQRRNAAGQFAEAAEFFARAAAIEPKEADHWIDLGQAQARAGKPAEARKAFDQARGLSLDDALKLRAAHGYDQIGDFRTAGELADALLPSLGKRLADLRGDAVGEDVRDESRHLAEAWYLVGNAALQADDPARAERYLKGAWVLEFLPEAGWALGSLRERQGRLADAVELWSQAAAIPTADAVLPADRQARIAAACAKLPEPTGAQSAVTVTPQGTHVNPARQVAAEGGLMSARTVRVTGPVIADVVEDILLVAGRDGTVEKVKNLSPKDHSAVDRQLARLGPIRLPSAPPDERPFKSVRNGILACASVSGCAVVLDLPGVARLKKNAATVTFESLDPKDGTVLHPGQHVSLTAKVRYEVPGVETIIIGLAAGAEPQAALGASPPQQLPGGTGQAELHVDFTVPEHATRVHAMAVILGDDHVTPPTVTASYPVAASK